MDAQTRQERMIEEDKIQDGPVILTVDLWRTYRAGTHQEVHALQGVDLEIDSGSYLALKGRSGSGKTTLLNLIGGLDKPTKGSVQVFGIELKEHYQ